jgi:hypothetical protein
MFGHTFYYLGFCQAQNALKPQLSGFGDVPDLRKDKLLFDLRCIYLKYFSPA